MARKALMALVAAAGTAGLLVTSAAVYAEQEQGMTRSGGQSAQQQRDDARQPTSQGMGGTSGAATQGLVQGAAGSAGPSPYDNTYLTPYEIRTPGARDNTDD